MEFSEAVAALTRGDFSRLESVLHDHLVAWVEMGRFEDEPRAFAEALSAASFNGQTLLVGYLLDRGADPREGAGTGMTPLHWAANRGNVRTVRLLLERGAPLEAKNAFGGTVLSGTVWSALHEMRDDHLATIEALVDAGADVSTVALPTGDSQIDALLSRAK